MRLGQKMRSMKDSLDYIKNCAIKLSFFLSEVIQLSMVFSGGALFEIIMEINSR